MRLKHKLNQEQELELDQQLEQFQLDVSDLQNLELKEKQLEQFKKDLEKELSQNDNEKSMSGDKFYVDKNTNSIEREGNQQQWAKNYSDELKKDSEQRVIEHEKQIKKENDLDLDM